MNDTATWITTDFSRVRIYGDITTIEERWLVKCACDQSRKAWLKGYELNTLHVEDALRLTSRARFIERVRLWVKSLWARVT